MSILVKLVGHGIGLAAEAKQHRKDKKAREASSSSPSPLASPSEELDAPPVYAELPPDEATALIKSSAAEPVSREQYGDEEAWELDDAAEEADPEAEQRTERESKDAFAQALARLPPPDPTRKLPCAVILPQRRPRAKARGFVRAYAPVLMESGIDQEAFLTFMGAWEKESKASPIFTTIQIGAGIAGMVPSVTVMITTTIIQVAVGVAKEVQSRKRTNSFLDDANQKLFMPRGLYCMVMKFDPEKERPISSSEVNINDSILKYTSDAGKKLKSSFRVASGKTYGEVELPEAAPLVYPALDQALDDADDRKRTKLKRGGEFLDEYKDRRAQAIYVDKNPDSKLVTQPRPQFASVYSDPSHPANTGSLLALVSKGKIQGPHGRRDGGRGGGGGLGGLVGGLVAGRETGGHQYGGRAGGRGMGSGGLIGLVGGMVAGSSRETGAQQYRGQQQGEQQYGEQQYEGQHSGHYGGQQSGYVDSNNTQHKAQPQPGPRRDRFGREITDQGGFLGTGVGGEYMGKGPRGLVKRVMRQDVLYLLIVNLPTDQEILEARERLGMQG